MLLGGVEQNFFPVAAEGILVVGLGVGWLATQKALAFYQVRLQALEVAVDRLNDNSARLVRVESLLEVSLGLRNKAET